MQFADTLLTERSRNFLVQVGRWLVSSLWQAGQALVIMLQAMWWFSDIYKRRRDVGRQMYICGIKSFLVTEVVALFTGMILSLQAGLVLRDYGQETNVGVIVSQTMCREMGPFMTALILAASVGSAMAAELGTMTVSEEIDALEVMSINPVRYLVMPRLLALMIMTPLLTIYTDVIGIVGGGLVANTQLGVPWHAYYLNVMDFLKQKEVFIGLLKAWVFGITVATVSCYQGLATTNGAIGVGKATRKAVVVSFLTVLILGYFITRLFY